MWEIVSKALKDVYNCWSFFPVKMRSSTSTNSSLVCSRLLTVVIKTNQQCSAALLMIFSTTTLTTNQFYVYCHLYCNKQCRAKNLTSQVSSHGTSKTARYANVKCLKYTSPKELSVKKIAIWTKHDFFTIFCSTFLWLTHASACDQESWRAHNASIWRHVTEVPVLYTKERKIAWTWQWCHSFFVDERRQRRRVS